MEQTLQSITDLGVGGVAVVALLVAIWGWVRSQGFNQQLRLREADNETLQIKSSQQVEIVRAEANNNNALVTARFLDMTERLERQNERMINTLQDVAASNTQRAEAIKRNTAALDNFSDRFASELTSVKTAVNAAGEMMTASREATDSRLSSIQAGVEYGNKAIDETKAVIETLPVDTTKIVVEIGDKALNDHKRIQETVDKISQQIENLPAYLVKSLTPLIDELRIANKRLMDTEAQFIEVVKTVMPPPREFAAESTPLNERSAQAVADMRAELGRAEVGA